MKLQPNSKKELKRIAIGTLAFDAVMLVGLFVLSLLGVGTFDYRVLLGAAGGSAVAILNFTIMCLTIQKAVEIGEQKTMKAFIQGSYNGRLLLQAGWITAAFLISHINVIAAAIPLLFPNLTIFYLQSKGKLVEPSERTGDADWEGWDDEGDSDSRKGSFEV